MYKIEQESWGYRLTFGGFIDAAEMKAWVDESHRVVKTSVAGFGVFVDMRTLKPLPQDSQTVMQEGQKLYKSKGMRRSVVILASTVVTLQFKRIAQETGIYAWERYLDSSSVPDWEAKGIGWIRDSIDPDTGGAVK
jgi:hypothetical protein